MKPVRTLLAGAAVASAALAATAVPTAASAQGYYGDPCRTERTNRGIIGGLLGAGAGVVLGNNVTGRNDRDTGRVVGGVIGGLLGSGVGRNTGACAPGAQYGYAPQPYGYAQPSYGYAQPQYGYAQPSYGYAQPSYGYPAGGYSDPYSHRGYAGQSYPSYPQGGYSGGYRYESHTTGTVYPNYGVGHSRPAYYGYGY